MTNLNGVAVDAKFDISNGVEVSRNCGVLFKGNFYVYGGDSKRTEHQIAKVQNCALEKIGELPFPLSWGGCAANANSLFLCFHYWGTSEEGKTCHVSNEPTQSFIEIPKSIGTHRQTRPAATDG